MADRDPMPMRASRRREGFSLIEVLGAVAILGISYVMIATLAMQGMQLTGESQRRIRASLIADEVLAEFELAALIGQPIEIVEEERNEDGFTILTEVHDLSLVPPEPASEDEAYDLFTFLSKEANGPHAEFRQSNLLLGYLREIHIQVQWREGINELVVSRTTYLFDFEAWQNREEAQGDGGPEL